MNFFNGLRIKKDIEDYYYYSGKDPLFKNLITLIDHNLGYSVFQAIEKTKIELSTTEKSKFNYRKMGIEINEEISIKDYSDIIAKEVSRISNYLDEFLTTNNLDPKNIDSLFLTGGTSMVKAIQDLFKLRFPHLKINSGDNFKSVAKGLAYSGYLFED